MSSDTLVVVGAEGVIYPLVAQGVAGVPALIGEALAGISFSTGLSSYRKYSTASAGMSVWCADETIALMQGILSSGSPVDVAACTSTPMSGLKKYSRHLNYLNQPCIYLQNMMWGGMIKHGLWHEKPPRSLTICGAENMIVSYGLMRS